jgi:peptidoglycan-associated lipoprotein
MRPILLIGLSCLALVAPACADDQPQPKTASDQSSVTQTTYAPVTTQGYTAQPKTDTDQTLNVGPRLRQACGIDDVNRAPKFDFDKSSLSGNDRDIAAQIATCLTSGPLKGKNVYLVGRADPRGTETHNMSLGQQRADAFKDYLVALGIDSSRISDSSRGALDAQGTSEESWRRDRRVDIELAQ